MKSFTLDPVVKEAFSISGRHDSATVVLKLSGNGDVDAHLALGGCLKQAHGEALRLGASTVAVDCTELYFMSPACVKCLLHWVDGIKNRGAPDNYKIEFRVNPNLPWQQRSFEPLHRAGPSFVRVVDATATSSLTTAACSPTSGTVLQAATTAPSGTIQQAGRTTNSSTIPNAAAVPQTPARRRA
jgi:hypothetical protein